MKVHLDNRGRNVIVFILAFSMISIFVYCLVSTTSWINRSFPGFVVLNNRLVPTISMPGWAGLQNGVRFGDVVLSMDGKELADGDEMNAMAARKEPGAPVTYTLRRGKDVLQVTVPVSTFTLGDYLLLFPGFMLIGLFYYAVGVAVFYIKPNDTAARAMMLNGVVIGMAMVVTPEYATNHTNPFSLFLLPLAGPSLVTLGLYFPEKYKIAKYAMPAALASGVPIIIPYAWLFHDVEKFVIVDAIMLVHISVNNAIGLFLMFFSFVRSKDRLTRQKFKIVSFGIGLAIVLGVLFMVGHLILKIMSFFWFLPFGLLVIPLSISYAILKNNLFDVDDFIKKSLGWVVSSVLVVACFSGLNALVGLALSHITADYVQISEGISVLVVVVLFLPMHNIIKTFIDKRFAGEEYEYQDALLKSAKVLARIIDKDRLFNDLLDTILNSIKIERGVLLIRDEETGAFHIQAARDYSMGFQPGGGSFGHDEEYRPVCLEHDNPLVFHLEGIRTPLQIHHVEAPGVFGKDREPMILAMRSLGLDLVVPIFFEHRMTGILGLGPKGNGAWYTSVDEHLLQTLMDQAAVSIENADNIEKMKQMVKLEAAYEELKKVDEMKDNILSMVSHDLRTPLTGILAYASLMKESIGSLDEKSQIKYLTVIVEQGERMTRLINDLLDIQRFEFEKATMEFTDINLPDLVASTVEIFKGAAEEKSIKLSSQVPSEEIMVRGNWDRLQQALTNLLSNAVKFTPKKGIIRVSIEIRTRSGNKAARVSVTDNGPGVDKKYHASLFDKFQQGDKLIRDKAQGSGLGLALVREIIRAHDGKVGLQSEPGRGSSFYFLLPTKESTPSDHKEGNND